MEIMKKLIDNKKVPVDTYVNQAYILNENEQLKKEV
jgi:hypothetical protein